MDAWTHGHMGAWTLGRLPKSAAVKGGQGGYEIVTRLQLKLPSSQTPQDHDFGTSIIVTKLIPVGV